MKYPPSDPPAAANPKGIKRIYPRDAGSPTFGAELGHDDIVESMTLGAAPPAEEDPFFHVASAPTYALIGEDTGEDQLPSPLRQRRKCRATAAGVEPVPRR